MLRSYASFQSEGEGMANMRLNGVTLNQLRNRQALLISFNRFRHEVDRQEVYGGVDSLSRRAFDVLTSSRLVEDLH